MVGRLVGFAVIFSVGLSAPAADRAGHALTGPGTPEEIEQLVKRLGDSSYEQRMFATRRLCAIGHAARDALRAAAEGEHVETALRARLVLEALDNLWFSGIEITLSFSKPRFAWDESVDLAVTMTNRSTHPAKLPFEIERREGDDDADTRQVGDMIDVAEWLRVTSEDGREVSMRVDDITFDDAVAATVRERVDAAPSGTLSPGQSVTITARAFNRGWARFPLLDRGAYRIVLEYNPPWEDEVLAEVRVGRVVSNELVATVTESAPPMVSRRGAEASVELRREGDLVVASLLNRMDQPIQVNRNLGAAPPFAQARWVCERKDTMRDVPVLPLPAASWADFNGQRLTTVAPGDSVELTRTNLDDLRNRLIQAGIDVRDGDWEVYFSYSNLCDRQWQKRQGDTLTNDPSVPQSLREPLPRRLLSGWHTSNRISPVDDK